MKDNNDETNIAAIARAVAAALGDGWTLQPAGEFDTARAELIKPAPLPLLGDLRLFFHNQYRDKGKFTVCGTFPKHRDGSEIMAARAPYNHSGPWHSIGISNTKTPAQIAADIKRRLLPDYLAQFGIVLQQKAEIEGKLDRRLAIAREVAAALGAPLRLPDRETNGTPSCARGRTYQGEPACEVKFQYDGDCCMEVRVKVALAKRIAAMIAEELDRLAALTADEDAKIAAMAAEELAACPDDQEA